MPLQPCGQLENSTLCVSCWVFSRQGRSQACGSSCQSENMGWNFCHFVDTETLGQERSIQYLNISSYRRNPTPHTALRFYPSDRLTLPYTIVDSGISLSHVIAAPLAAGCLSLSGLGGLQGWQWLFLLEGAPTLLLAFVMYTKLPNSLEEGKTPAGEFFFFTQTPHPG